MNDDNQGLRCTLFIWFCEEQEITLRMAQNLLQCAVFGRHTLIKNDPNPDCVIYETAFGGVPAAVMVERI